VKLVCGLPSAGRGVVPMPQRSSGSLHRLNHAISWPSLPFLLLRLALGRAALLRHSAAREAALPLPVASQPYFFLQKVGLEVAADGAQAPRLPHNDKANQCLTAGSAKDKDTLDGTALYWTLCQDSTFRSKLISDPARREAQLFQFQEDGTVKSRSSGLCIRRMECSRGPRFLYDLGNCKDSNVLVKFQVKKALASNMKRMKDLGTLVQAVATEACTICGPFQLVERCKSGRPAGSSVGCQRSYQATPGWTKLASSYVGDAAASGHGDLNADSGESLWTIISNIWNGEVPSFDVDMSGIGETDRDGICGSYVTDAPDLSSFFYLILGEWK